MSTTCCGLIGRIPRALTGVSARGLENWRSTPGTTGGARKIASIPPKKPSHAHHPFIATITAKMRAEDLSLLRAGMSTISAMNRIWGASTATHDHRDVHNIDELRQPTSTTTAPVVAHNGHGNDLVESSTSCNCGTSAVFCSLKPKCTCRRKNGHRHLVQELHLSSQQRACPLCSRTAPQCTCRRNNGHVHLVQNCNCGTPQFFARLNTSTVCRQRA